MLPTIIFFVNKCYQTKNDKVIIFTVIYRKTIDVSKMYQKYVLIFVFLLSRLKSQTIY